MGNGESNSGFQMKLKEVGSLLNYFFIWIFQKKKKDKNLKRKKLETFNFIYLVILQGEKFLN